MQMLQHRLIQSFRSRESIVFHLPFSNDPIVSYNINDDELHKMKQAIQKALKYFEHKNVDKVFAVYCLCNLLA